MPPTLGVGHNKNVLFGSMEGVRCRGRQPKRWLYNISEWTGMSIGDAVKMTQDRYVCRKFVYLASTVRDHETR